MPALRCPTCLTDWPTTGKYTRCPRCKVATDRMSGADAMLHADADSEISHIEFERMYAHREKQREKRGDPSPEQIGSIEAREIYKLEQILKEERDGERDDEAA